MVHYNIFSLLLSSWFPAAPIQNRDNHNQHIGIVIPAVAINAFALTAVRSTASRRQKRKASVKRANDQKLETLFFIDDTLTDTALN